MVLIGKQISEPEQPKKTTPPPKGQNNVELQAKGGRKRLPIGEGWSLPGIVVQTGHREGGRLERTKRESEVGRGRRGSSVNTHVEDAAGFDAIVGV